MKRILSIVLLLLTLAPATMMQAQTEQNKPQARRERPQSGMQTQRLARQMAQQPRGLPNFTPNTRTRCEPCVSACPAHRASVPCR